MNAELRAALVVRGLPTQRDRGRAVLGHVMASVPVNSLAPRQGARRRHPKMALDGVRPQLLEVVNTARGAIVVTWLDDSMLRIGGLAGLHHSGELHDTACRTQLMVLGLRPVPCLGA